MKFTIPTKKLAAALATIKSVARPSTTHAVLGNVCITADKNGITLLGADLEKQLSIMLECVVKKTGATTVPCGRLHDSLAKARGLDCVIESNDAHEMTIRVGEGVAKIRGLDPAELPAQIIVPDGIKVTMDAGKFSDTIKKALIHSSVDQSRAVLCSVFALSNKGKLTFIGADGKRAGICETETEFVSDDAYVIPRESIPTMAALTDSGEIEIGFSDGVMSVKSNSAEFATKLIEGNGTAMSKTIIRSIPEGRETRVECMREDLIGVIEYAEVQTMADGKKVFIECDGSKLCAEGVGSNAKAPDDDVFMELSREQCPVTKGASQVSFAINPQFLRKSLKCLTGDKVTLEMASPKHALVMQEPGIICAIMPMV